MSVNLRKTDVTEIELRPITEADTDKIVHWRNQDFVRSRFLYQEPFTREGHLHWLRAQVDTGRVVQFLIVLPDGREIGSVYFRDIDRTAGCAEYGIFIGEEDALGCGYGTQAAQAALEYAFGTLKLGKVFLRVLADNERAVRSYERVGFRVIRDREETVELADGKHRVIFMEKDQKQES